MNRKPFDKLDTELIGAIMNMVNGYQWKRTDIFDYTKFGLTHDTMQKINTRLFGHSGVGNVHEYISYIESRSMQILCDNPAPSEFF